MNPQQETKDINNLLHPVKVSNKGEQVLTLGQSKLGEISDLVAEILA